MFLKTNLKFVPRVDPINHRHTEHMRQSYVSICAKITLEQNLNVPELKLLPDVCVHWFLENCFSVPSHNTQTTLWHPEATLHLHGIHSADSCRHCHQNNAVNIFSSFHAIWLIFPLRGFTRDFLYSFLIPALISDFLLKLEELSFNQLLKNIIFPPGAFIPLALDGVY